MLRFRAAVMGRVTVRVVVAVMVRVIVAARVPRMRVMGWGRMRVMACFTVFQEFVSRCFVSTVLFYVIHNDIVMLAIYSFAHSSTDNTADTQRAEAGVSCTDGCVVLQCIP